MPKRLTPQDQWETEFEAPLPGEPRNIGPLETLFQRLLNRTERLKNRIGAIIGGAWDSTPPDTLTGLDARVTAHRTAPVLDHPDGSVTLAKLAPSILGQPGGLAILNAIGALASPDAYLHRGLLYTAEDWNDITNAGVYNVYPAAFSGTNPPPARYTYGHLVVFRGGVVITQIYIPHTNDPGIYWRQAWDGDWSAWSSAGAQRGGNANGQFIRFADGTQICWATHPNDTFGSTNMGSDSNYRHRIKTWVYPAAFAYVPAVLIAGDVAGGRVDVFTAFDATTAQVSLEVGQYNSTTITVSYCATMAIGRWF